MIEQERTREREPEPSGTKYDEVLRRRDKWVERAMTGKVLIRGTEREYEVGRQGRLKRYLQPQFHPETALSDWIVFINHIQRQSGRHRHQGSLVLFVLEGEGASEVEGRRVDWKTGDLLLLPVKPHGVTHQHFNKDQSSGCRWMAFIYEPFSRYLMDQIVQLEDMPTDQNAVNIDAKLNRLDDARERIGQYSSETDDYRPLHVKSPSDLASVNLLDELYRIRDHQRFLSERATWKISGDELPWETNQQGIMRWYMHPSIDYACLRSLLFYMQRIPVGSRSGRQRHSGNALFYILAGNGHTILDGVTYSWGPGDMMTLPNRPDGVVYQHFNDDPSQDVCMIGCEPNLISPIGLDRNAPFEQVEVCPEFRALG